MWKVGAIILGSENEISLFEFRTRAGAEHWDRALREVFGPKIVVHIIRDHEPK
jgi:hypothetical protein